MADADIPTGSDGQVEPGFTADKVWSGAYVLTKYLEESAAVHYCAHRWGNDALWAGLNWEGVLLILL